MKILIIDEDKATRKIIEKKMNALNYEIKCVKNFFDGIAILDKEKFDLIITETIIAGISGLSLVSVLKEFIRRKMPIVIISSTNEYQTIQTGLKLGEVDFLIKPIDFEKLISICKKHSSKTKIFL